ncbi:hypothetical protein O9993_15860 [Vibrio lentus]|nr:hypothetical protein [Vibrio lentus]
MIPAGFNAVAQCWATLGIDNEGMVAESAGRADCIGLDKFERSASGQIPNGYGRSNQCGLYLVDRNDIILTIKPQSSDCLSMLVGSNIDITVCSGTL